MARVCGKFLWEFKWHVFVENRFGNSNGTLFVEEGESRERAGNRRMKGLQTKKITGRGRELRERAGKQPEERILIEKVRRARPGVERATREAAKSKDFN